MNILLLSDTHGFLDPPIMKQAATVDEIWHAGDFGSTQVADQLEKVAVLRGVYGNIDGQPLRVRFPKEQEFVAGGIKVFMTHIGGYPGRYATGIKEKLKNIRPALFIAGHSHMLKIMRDASLDNLLYMNPGAAGKEGFHTVRTLVLFSIRQQTICDMRVVELGNR